MAVTMKKPSEREDLLDQLNAITRREIDGTEFPTDTQSKVTIERRLKRITVAPELVSLQKNAASLSAESLARKRYLQSVMADDAAVDAFKLPMPDLLIQYKMPKAPSVGRLTVHSKLHEAIGDIVARTSAQSEPAEPPLTVSQIAERDGGLVCVTGEWMAQASPDMQRIVAESDSERVVVMQAEHFLKWRDVPGLAEHVNGRQLIIVG